MRLLNTETLQLESFDREPLPKYVILSHRWHDGEEVSFQELQAGQGLEKSGYRKIARFCEEARKREIEWCWIDTCGIDKTSSAELSEAINSMYRWYEQSAVCFVYLSDVAAQRQSDDSYIFPDFSRSLWFTRGWTLQELIAARSVEFYSSDWLYIGNKRSKVDEVSDITGVDKDVLRGSRPVRACSVAKIMSWAHKRVTTRTEDIAYSLLGLFGIYMPLLYGEADRAFIRLQEEILKQSSDQSLFAWNPLLNEATQTSASTNDTVCSIFAPSPACFADTGHVVPLQEYWDTESTLTNRGVRLRMPFQYDPTNKTFLGILCCRTSSYEKDVAIEFQSASNSLEDLDHLIRRPTRIRHGNWFHTPGIQLKMVYLATEVSLWHARYYGLDYLKPEFVFHIILADEHNYVESKEMSAIFPLEGRSQTANMVSKTSYKRHLLGIVTPLKCKHNRLAIKFSTTLSLEFALIVGFRTLPGGFPDVSQPWHVAKPVLRHHRLEDIWTNTKEPSKNEQTDVSKIMIDGITISFHMDHLSWSMKSSRAITIVLSPPAEDQPVEQSRWKLLRSRK